MREVVVALAMVCLAGGCLAQSVATPLRPTAVAYDAAGNAYFADSDRNQVYSSTVGGELLVVAGSGVQGFAGDGGAATAAELNAPQGVAIGAAGEIYIADTGNQRVRVVRAGTIGTFAGNGRRGFAGDGGAATAASLSTPTALAVDATGALLVCDTGNARVRRISAGTIATIAGTGTQGFAGDGGPATNAELDGPQGVAVASDGRIFIADSRNHRIRVVAVDGTISTVAGTGARGFSGDQAAATAAQLDLPRGLAMLANGVLVFADSDNRRIRAISPGGTISTLIGTGAQGASGDGTASLSVWLNAPRAVAMSSLGEVTLADSANRTVQALASNSAVYSVAGLAPARSSTVALTGAASATYGQWSGQVSVSGVVTPQGSVQVMEHATNLQSVALQNGAAAVGASMLSAGPHVLSAVYSGDGINPAASSATLPVAIAPAPVSATADAVSILYGQPIPALTGTLSGVLAQDIGSVSAVFSTTAAALSPVGSYPIAAQLTGAAAGNYVLPAGTAAGTLTIAQAPTVTTEPAQATGSYAGMPLPLRAVVGSTTSGTPSGVVSFLENGSTLAQATLAGGLATASFAAPATGTHSIVASYAGDSNFQGSSSAAQSFVVAALPDFVLNVMGSASQTVAGGSIATYSLSIAAQPPPFTGAVAMSVAGVPTGCIASFSPASVVPGSSAVPVTLSITTPVKAELQWPPGGARRSIGVVAAGLLAMPFAFPAWRRRRRRRLLAVLPSTLLCGVGLTLTGCGARVAIPATKTSATYNLTVTATGTNLAGVVVSHATQLTLVID